MTSVNITLTAETQSMYGVMEQETKKEVTLTFNCRDSKTAKETLDKFSNEVKKIFFTD